MGKRHMILLPPRDEVLDPGKEQLIDTRGEDLPTQIKGLIKRLERLSRSVLIRGKIENGEIYKEMANTCRTILCRLLQNGHTFIKNGIDGTRICSVCGKLEQNRIKSKAKILEMF